MGNTNPVISSCCEQNIASEGPEFVQSRHKNNEIIRRSKISLSISNSASISIDPNLNGTMRSSITEFSAAKNYLYIERNLRTPETSCLNNSIPNSPGRYFRKEAISKNYTKQCFNLVSQIRSKSLSLNPQKVASQSSEEVSDKVRNKDVYKKVRKVNKRRASMNSSILNVQFNKDKIYI